MAKLHYTTVLGQTKLTAPLIEGIKPEEKDKATLHSIEKICSVDPDTSYKSLLLFVLMLYIPVNNFSVMSGKFPVFLG